MPGGSAEVRVWAPNLVGDDNLAKTQGHARQRDSFLNSHGRKRPEALARMTDDGQSFRIFQSELTCVVCCTAHPEIWLSEAKR